MCQLLGMNSSKPATLGFSFAGFAERGGRTGEHRDGWGIAFHEAAGCRLITDGLPSSASPLAAGLKHNVRHDAFRARNVVAHIRKATQGEIAPRNSHPFTRSLWGSTWSFAHNGNLEGFHPDANEHFQPDGEIDSERAFCSLLAGLRRRFGVHRPSRQALFDAVAAMAFDVARHGSFNFILSDGELLLAHCSTDLHYVVREYPFTKASLVDCDVQIDFGRHNHLDDRMAVIATLPLTSGEVWRAFEPGELKMFVHGAPFAPSHHDGAARSCLQVSC
ncbi:MAG: glutamine amidotransferase class-II family protein [Massilia sp.]|nr:glutamine amidotransferase class-II family protein [Massilia sp.]